MSAGNDATASIRRGTKAVQWAYGGIAVFFLLRGALALRERVLVARTESGDATVGDFELIADLADRLLWVAAAFALVHAVAWGLVFRQGHRALGERGVPLPGSARSVTFSFLIPFANLWLPPRNAGALLRAASRSSDIRLVRWWWGLLVGCIVLTRIAVANTDGDAEQYRNALATDAVAAGIGVAFAVVGARLAATLAHHLTDRLAEPWPPPPRTPPVGLLAPQVNP